MTLREGLDRHHAKNAAVFSEADLSPEAQAFFRCHDVAHVVFGCDTSLCGEGLLKIFTIFGTTMGFRTHLAAYAQAGAFGLFRQYGLRAVLRDIGRLCVRIPRAIVRARRMTKPWPWSDHGEYLDVSIADIRREFNIEVVSS